MTQVRMKVTVTFEYNADPEHYPEHKREPSFMAEVDQYEFVMDHEYMGRVMTRSTYTAEINVEPIDGNP